jgi:nucleotide-binding universal stress UspA family protein
MSESSLRIEPAGESEPVLSIPPLSIKEVVVGYVDEECGNKALLWAEAIATYFEAQLVVTHSVPPPPGVIDIYYEQLKEEVRNEAHTNLTKAVLRHLKDPSRRVQEVVTFDSPTKIMLRTASQRNADLVVTGSHGRKGIDQLIFGSVSESLAFRCTCPVLVCGPACGAPTSKRTTVLFASTPAETSVRAAEYSRAIAERAGFTLIAMQTLAERAPTDAQARRWKEDYARELLRIALGEPSEHSDYIQYCIQYGDPAAEVLALAAREGAGLIVLGSGERLPGADHFAWRPVGQILRAALCPVLIVSGASK